MADGKPQDTEGSGTNLETFGERRCSSAAADGVLEVPCADKHVIGGSASPPATVPRTSFPPSSPGCLPSPPLSPTLPHPARLPTSSSTAPPPSLPSSFPADLALVRPLLSPSPPLSHRLPCLPLPALRKSPQGAKGRAAAWRRRGSSFLPPPPRMSSPLLASLTSSQDGKASLRLL